jgi:hypothetical protein
MNRNDEIRMSNAESVQSVTSVARPILRVYWSPFVVSSPSPGFAGRSSQKSFKKLIRRLRRFTRILKAINPKNETTTDDTNDTDIQKIRTAKAGGSAAYSAEAAAAKAGSLKTMLASPKAQDLSGGRTALFANLVYQLLPNLYNP